MRTLYFGYLRELAAAVESGGMSGHGAVGHIGVGGNTAIGWIRHLRKTCGVGPCQIGRHTLTSISSERLTWLLERTKKNFTLRGLVGRLTERGRKVDNLTVCGFAGTEELNFRKTVVTGERGRLDVTVTRKITASRQNLSKVLHSSLVGIGRFRAAVICLSAWPATAYRPFDGSDAAKAGVNEIEVELQPIGRLQIMSQPTLISLANGYLYAIALGLTFEMGWGSKMKKMVLAAAVLAMAGSAFAADMPLKAVKAPPLAPFDPWDIAFGSAVMSDYIFRGVTQSNHNLSVAAYFEPRYNLTKDLQLYIGTSVESISFANRAAAEVDVYGGIRPTFGAFAFDFGVWGYLYPGGNCADNFLTGGFPGGNVCPVSTSTIFLANGNVMKKDVSFVEVYGKVNYTINDNWQFGVNEYYSPNFLNSGAWGDYASITGKYTAPSTTFGTSGVGMYVSGEVGRQWLGTSDAFYGVVSALGNFARGIPYASYDTWNIGIGFTYKVFTLDLRYSDSDLSKGNCNAFTSAFNASGTTNVTSINPGGAGSNWCGAAGIVKLSADLTAMTNLK